MLKQQNTFFSSDVRLARGVWFIPGGIQTYTRQHMDYEADRRAQGKGMCR